MKNEVIWARPLQASRGPQPAYTRERVARTAVDLADAEGLEAVSMRRVAAELGTRATSLYRYVRSKEELLDLMVDAVVGEARLPKPSGDWRVELRAIARQTRTTLLRHSWMVAVSARSSLGPNSLALTEATLRALDGRGLDADTMLVVASTLTSVARGYAAEEIAEQQSEARSGLDREQWMESQSQYLAALREAGRFPLIMRIIVDEARAPHRPRHRGFDAAIACVLDGVETLLARRAR